MARSVVLVFLNRAWNAGCFFLLSLSLSPTEEEPFKDKQALRSSRDHIRGR